MAESRFKLLPFFIENILATHGGAVAEPEKCGMRGGQRNGGMGGGSLFP